MIVAFSSIPLDRVDASDAARGGALISLSSHDAVTPVILNGTVLGRSPSLSRVGVGGANHAVASGDETEERVSGLGGASVGGDAIHLSGVSIRAGAGAGGG